MTIEILRIHDYYVTLFNKNVTEWLATPGGTKFFETIEEMPCKRTECLSDVLTRLRGRKMVHITKVLHITKVQSP